MGRTESFNSGNDAHRERERERGRRQRREQDETRKGAVGYFAPSPSSFSGHLLADSAEKL